jgi:hypothetical protein
MGDTFLTSQVLFLPKKTGLLPLAENSRESWGAGAPSEIGWTLAYYLVRIFVFLGPFFSTLPGWRRLQVVLMATPKFSRQRREPGDILHFGAVITRRHPHLPQSCNSMGEI